MTHCWMFTYFPNEWQNIISYLLFALLYQKRTELWPKTRVPLHPSILNMAPTPFPKNIHLSALSATCMVWLSVQVLKENIHPPSVSHFSGILKKKEKKKREIIHVSSGCILQRFHRVPPQKYSIASPRSWVCPLVYSEHSDRLTGVTLCSTWLNAAQQWSNDVHTAYSPGRISHSRTTAESFLKTLRQMKQPFPHSPFTLLQLAHRHSLLHLFVHIH